MEVTVYNRQTGSFPQVILLSHGMPSPLTCNGKFPIFSPEWRHRKPLLSLVHLNSVVMCVYLVKPLKRQGQTSAIISYVEWRWRCHYLLIICWEWVWLCACPVTVCVCVCVADNESVASQQTNVVDWRGAFYELPEPDGIDAQNPDKPNI